MKMIKESKKQEILKNATTITIPIETDINILDSKPDARQVIFDKIQPKVEEIKVGTNKVWVKGKLMYQILYRTEKAEELIASMSGEVPFMEEIYLEGVDSADQVMCQARIENEKIQIINSRKLNMQTKLILQPKVFYEIEQEYSVDVEKEASEKEMAPRIEWQRQNLDYLESKATKRDLLRIHEEIMIPETYASADEIYWKGVDVRCLDFEAFEEKIAAHGEMDLFLFYREEQNQDIGEYCVTIPFSQSLVCQECQENMITDISFSVNHEEISVRENENGDNRIVNVEIVIELEMKLWKSNHTGILSDLYGMNCEVSAKTEPVSFLSLVNMENVQESFSKTSSLENAVEKMIYDRANVEIDQCMADNNLVTIWGHINHDTLCKLSGEENAYMQHKEKIPFTCQEQFTNVKKDMFCKTNVIKVVNHAQMDSKDEISYTTEVTFEILLMKEKMSSSVQEVEVLPIDQINYDAIPGITVYVVQNGDTLWQLGKQYYLSVDAIKEMNGLTSDTIEAGDKLILMKNM